MDETYQTYVNRVAPMTVPANYKQKLQNIQKSAKFEGEEALPFPGYTLIIPTWQDDSDNEAFYNKLKSYQEQLLEELAPGLMIPVPPESFHLTVADLIWDNRYRDALEENTNFDNHLRDRISNSFDKYKQSFNTTSPIQLQLLGLTIFTRAIVVCLIPKDEQGYERILQARRSIYQNPGIIALGIEQHYHFTAHITLGYFGEIAPDLDRDRTLSALAVLNDKWLEIEPPLLTIKKAELRKFDDMMHYYRQPDWPVLEF
ncbi:MAG: DUF1868 domain-containing protein [Moorea sp. SIO2B7]|nr:DUF1868 domain-containing protein [Moorena sp. SIO2B7]